MTRRKRGLAAAILAIAAPAGAGPWGQGAGHGYAELTYNTLSTEELATPDGQIQQIPTFDLREVRFYGELGLGDRFTFIGSFPLDRYSAIEGFDSASGVGDLRLGLQVQVGNPGPWVFAARGILQAPTGDETKGAGLLPTGSGAWEGEAWLAAGRSFGGGWFYGEGGYQVRGAGLRDGFVYAGEIGAHLGSRIDLSFRLAGVEPFESGQGEEALGLASGLGDGVRYLNYGPSLGLRLGGGFGAIAKVDRAAHASNLARGTTFRIGLSFKR